MTIRKLVGTLENKGPYIDQATGHWFYWNGTKYVDSGYPYIVLFNYLGGTMKYIKYFETLEEYEEWMAIESNAQEVYESEEKICVDGIILSHTNKAFAEGGGP